MVADVGKWCAAGVFQEIRGASVKGGGGNYRGVTTTTRF